ncbi:MULTISPECIES: heme/hemin ABC transporter substrate-binding protein [unclassified Halomonas]|uniref:heme/hemin ABC transporter substrate-binding protein n=1 Tax=unclassified Halomonas TaxID=2609666 RepID=UPI004033A638
MTQQHVASRLVAMMTLAWLCVGTPLAHADEQPSTNERWVVLGGDIAETLAALSADANVIARDDTVLYPPAMADLPSVGYLRQLSAESVLSVQPDRVLAAEHAGPKEVLEQLTAVGITIDIIAAPNTLEAIPAKVRAVAQQTNRQREGERLAVSLTAKLERLAALPALPPIRAMFVMQHSGLTPRVAGSGTAAHTALEAVGLENAFATMQGYHNVGAEALAKEAPELMIMSQRGLDALGGETALWQLPGMALTPAGHAQRLIIIDDQALLGFGPRAPDQLLALRQQVEALLTAPTTARTNQ